jgi:hypothetical protein
MASPSLERLRRAVRESDRAKKLATTVNVKQQLIKDALREHGRDSLSEHSAWELRDKISDCGTDRRRCGSPYCVRCHSRFLKGQERPMRRLFNRYASEVDQRQNIRFLTILFDAYGFDARKSFGRQQFSLAFPLRRTQAAIKYARAEIQVLKRRFPKLKIVGAFEMDVLDATARSLRNDATTLQALLKAGEVRDQRASFLRLICPPTMASWQDHVIIFHAHLVVDLDGTDEQMFRDWCHKRWGKNCPNNSIPHGVHITRLRSDRAIENSIEMLARYPLKTPFHYHVPRDAKGRLVAPKRPLEKPILAAMVVGRSALGIRGIRVVGRI